MLRTAIITAALVLSATGANAMCNYAVSPPVCDSDSGPRNYFPSIGMAPPPQPIQTPYVPSTPYVPPTSWTVIETTPSGDFGRTYHGYGR